jgi:glutamyl-tRNA reductase
MKLLVVGVSHHTASFEVLERLSTPNVGAGTMLTQLVPQPHVREAVVLSTCNRMEIYSAVTGFHGGLAEIGAILAARADLTVAQLASHLYVHYDGEAARHALRVAAGLDSMVVGETQILGQLRDAYGLAAERDSAGRLLHELMQQALRVGKRVHAETGIDRAGQSVMTAAIDLVPGGVSARSAVVVGAGSMGSLALATLARAGADPLLVANRDRGRAHRLAQLHGAEAIDVADLPSALATTDLAVYATASAEPVLTAADLRPVLAHRPDGRELTILDLAVPRDVSPEVAGLPGVRLIDLAAVGASTGARPSTVDRDAAEAIVAAEAEAFLTWLRGADVGPTVAALRARADEVVESELHRLTHRRPDLTPEQRADVAHTVHRVVRRLLHSPTVRVRQLATTGAGDQYAAALRELFDLSVPAPASDLPRAVDVVRSAPPEEDEPR